MDEQQQFIERAGVILEMQGMSRAAGRVLGAILTAPPGGYNAGEVATVLQSSRAAISVALRQLLMVGLIEHAPVPGERADRYRFRQGSWEGMDAAGIRKLEAMHQLARDGLRSLPQGGDPTSLTELADTMEVYLELYPQFVLAIRQRLDERRKVQEHAVEEMLS
ncbi:GbsR/MarR family transcriptional regulator [Deinococcus antarcticus]|uniref:GbsR/MarR family transcriptional regulator n=1 Tax=Deinococcus antarcticus TaxID=1298767 RepID=A0ABV8A654_9DEIO